MTTETRIYELYGKPDDNAYGARYTFSVTKESTGYRFTSREDWLYNDGSASHIHMDDGFYYAGKPGGYVWADGGPNGKIQLFTGPVGSALYWPDDPARHDEFVWQLLKRRHNAEYASLLQPA